MKLDFLKFGLLLFVIFTWFFKPDIAYAADSSGIWKIVETMSSARFAHGGALLQDGRVIVTGGYNNAILNSSEIYNPSTKTWSTTDSMNQGRVLYTPPNLVTLSNGNVLIAAGEGVNISDLYTTEIYNPKTNSWTSGANVNTARRRAVLAPLPNGKVLLASGARGNSSAGRQLASAEIYDPDSNTWTFTTSMHIGRDSDERFVVLADGRVMIAGGESANKIAENTAEVYNSITAQWILSTMPFAMRGGTLTLLQNGKVLMTGGFNGVTNVNSTAIYNPETNTWTLAAPMATPRGGHQAILLSDGNVLIFGGNNATTPLKSSEIYNPSTNIWTPGPSLPSYMTMGVTVKLQNGDYLAFGGVDGNKAMANTYLFTNSTTNLSVPLLKQTAEPWGSMEYDSASLWNPRDPRIYSWGCAMTSAAMVFRYHGIKKLPDGTELDPGTLNAWLKAQPDGYVGSGNTNWLALQRLSKQTKAINNITSFDALQYKRAGFNKSQLTEDIRNGIPGILQVPGHFIVARGITEDSFNINDPFYNRYTLKDGYANTFGALGRFVPSFTDLSYIMINAASDTDIKVLDENGNEIGEQFIDEAIVNPENHTETNTKIKTFYLAEPSSGAYTILISTPNNHLNKISTYLYDIDGNVNIQHTNTFGTAQFTISFDKNTSNASTVKKTVTFESTFKDIDQAEQLGYVNKGVAVSLKAVLYAAEKQHTKNATVTKRILEGGLTLVKESSKFPQLISDEAYQIISYDWQSLIESTKE